MKKKKREQNQNQPPYVFYKKAALQENTWVRVFFKIKLQADLQFNWKETPTQVFSCDYCKMFKNTYFKKYLPTGASTEWKVQYITGYQKRVVPKWRGECIVNCDMLSTEKYSINYLQKLDFKLNFLLVLHFFFMYLFISLHFL